MTEHIVNLFNAGYSVYEIAGMVGADIDTVYEVIEQYCAA